MFWNRKPETSLGPEPNPDMTHDVRYALRERDSLLNPNDIAGLFANRLGNVGFYMTMKACKGDMELQTELLNLAASYEFDLSRFTKADASKALGRLATKEKPLVDGQKLKWIRSFGLAAWTQLFTQTLEPALAEQPEASLFMVANATYVGLDKIAALSIKSGRSLGILDPGTFETVGGQVGFMVEPASTGVEINSLEHEFPRPENAIIFDDALNFGNVRDRVLEFWGQDGHTSFITAFVERGSASAAASTLSY